MIDMQRISVAESVHPTGRLAMRREWMKAGLCAAAAMPIVCGLAIAVMVLG
jgi:hypothetical protein